MRKRIRLIEQIGRWIALLGLGLLLALLAINRDLTVQGIEPELLSAISWQQTALQYRGHMGDRLFFCPGQGQLGPLWGSDVYTDDSSICTAAVHAGVITVETGGAIAIRMLPGQINYPSARQNDVTSTAKPAWLGSFTFTSLHDPIAGVVRMDQETVPIQVIPWTTTAVSYRTRQGEAIAAYCPPNGTIESIWGTDLYRDASSICSAAVHASQISVGQGGTVAIRMRPGQTSYSGSIQQNVTSLPFGHANASFEFVAFK